MNAGEVLAAGFEVRVSGGRRIIRRDATRTLAGARQAIAALSRAGPTGYIFSIALGRYLTEKELRELEDVARS